MKQDHGLETGLDVHLVPLCKAALPDCESEGCGQEAEPVYVELEVQNTHRAVGTTLSHEVRKQQTILIHTKTLKNWHIDTLTMSLPLPRHTTIF